jgi:DNA-binding HxlR family transcriptional regulator
MNPSAALESEITLAEPSAGRARRGSIRARVAGAGNRTAAAADPTDPLAQALATVGDRWSLAVVASLTEGPQRFNDLADALVPIARTVLSDRLRRLEDSGVIAKKAYSQTPVRWSYRLTLAGMDLARVCGVLADWGARHLGDGGPALVHDSEACSGGAVTPVYSCDSCGVVPARELMRRRS